MTNKAQKKKSFFKTRNKWLVMCLVAMFMMVGSYSLKIQAAVPGSMAGGGGGGDCAPYSSITTSVPENECLQLTTQPVRNVIAGRNSRIDSTIALTNNNTFGEIWGDGQWHNDLESCNSNPPITYTETNSLGTISTTHDSEATPAATSCRNRTNSGLSTATFTCNGNGIGNWSATNTTGSCWGSVEICTQEYTYVKTSVDTAANTTTIWTPVITSTTCGSPQSPPANSPDTQQAATSTCTSTDVKGVCIKNYPASQVGITTTTGDDMFRINAGGTHAYFEYTDIGSPNNPLHRLKWIEVDNSNAIDRMIPSGPPGDHADYNAYMDIMDAKTLAVDGIQTEDGCHPIEVGLCAPADSGDELAGACGDASTGADYVYSNLVEIPGAYFCDEGLAINQDDSNLTTITWNCSGPPDSPQCSTIKPPINGTCGSSANIIVTSAPTSGLCAPGNASTTTDTSGTGLGPWTWTCAGLNGGTTASCATLPQNINGICGPASNSYTPQIGTCGSANGVDTATAPTSNLCSVGSASAVAGTGPWTWDCAATDGTSSCSANVAVTPCNDVWTNTPMTFKAFAPTTSCGPTGVVATTASVSCNGSRTIGSSCDGSVPDCVDFTAGTHIGGSASPFSAVPMESIGPNCSPGGPEPCMCRFAQKVCASSCGPGFGACGPTDGTSVASAPTSGLCSNGLASVVTGSGPWNWTCIATSSTANCSASITATDSCGTAQGSITSSQPSGAAACSVGAFSDTADTGTSWNWNCGALSCFSNKPALPCGGSWVWNGLNWDDFPVGGTLLPTLPVSISTPPSGALTSPITCPAVAINGACGATNNLCASGTLNDTADIPTEYRWECLGSGGGTDDLNCSEPIINCGTANGQTFPLEPTTNLCDDGSTPAVTNNGGTWDWACGSNSCSATRQDACIIMHPIGWDDGGTQCVEYFATGPAATSLLPVGTTRTYFGNTCFGGGNCYGDVTFRCNSGATTISNGSFSTVSLSCLPGIRP